MQIVKAIILSLFIAIQSFTANADDWREYTTDNVIIYSNIQKTTVQELMYDIERVIPYLAILTGIDKTETPLPLTMYLYKTTSDVRKIVGDHQILGVYRPLLKGGVAATVGIDPIDSRKLGGRSFVLHEYVHHYLSQLSPLDYPIWYLEGFADVLSNINFDYDRPRVGETLRPRSLMLNDRGSWADISEIMAASIPDIGQKREWRGYDRFYSQSWLLAHMITTETDYSQNARYFLKQLSSGVSPADAVKSSYGIDLEQMNKDYKSHWKQGFPISYIDFEEIPFSEPKISVRKLNEKESRYIIWRSQADFAEEPERKYELSNMIAADLLREDSISLRLLHTELLLELDRPDLATKQLAYIMQKDPNNLEAEFMKARVNIDIAIRRYSALGPDAVDSKLYDEGHQYLSKFIAAHPNDTLALYQFGILHFLDDRADLEGDGIAALERAAELVPQNQEVKMLLAQAYSKLGKVEYACENANIVLKYSRDETLLKKAVKVINEQSMACPA